MSHAATINAPVPERLGRYPIQGVIGAGAMGVVYLGHDAQINRPVAIKTIAKHLLDGDNKHETAAGRFRIEAQAAGRLSHPGIVTVYDVGDDDQCAFIAMEYVAGVSLREYLSKGWKFSTAESVGLVSQLLDALGEAHAKGVIHRDIKPANLLIADNGRLKVSDFGIARIEATQFTRTESVIGTPGYMAPEQYLDIPVDFRADLFSAGVVLYRLLCGRLPFPGNEQAAMYRIVYGQHDPLCKDPRDEHLRAFEPVIEQALARQVDQRFASAHAFRKALLEAAPQGNSPEGLASDRRLPPANPGLAVAPAGSTLSAPVPTGWNETTLAGLERELAQIVGPIARVLVRRTAQQAVTLETLRQRVATNIADPRERERFLQAEGSARASEATNLKSRATGSTHTNTTFAATMPATGVRLSPEDVECAATVLLSRLGPIAKLLARRCASRATTREQFIAQVLQQIGDGVDREALTSQLWASWS